MYHAEFKYTCCRAHVYYHSRIICRSLEVDNLFYVKCNVYLLPMKYVLLSNVSDCFKKKANDRYFGTILKIWDTDVNHAQYWSIIILLMFNNVPTVTGILHNVDMKLLH